MHAAAGQLLYASEKLRAERGLDRKGKEALGNGRLLVGCAEISAAFWDTPWGRAMRDELDNKPFRPCVHIYGFRYIGLLVQPLKVIEGVLCLAVRWDVSCAGFRLQVPCTP